MSIRKPRSDWRRFSARWAGYAALASSVVTASSGCGASCKECKPGASVVFSRALDLSKVYDVRVVTDGEASSCSVTSGEVDCPFGAVRTNDSTLTTAEGTPFPKNGFAGIWIAGRPSTVEVTISDADRVVASAEFASIEYSEVERDGPGCGTCTAAAVELTVR